MLRRNDGFTLIEVMVVIAMIGILSAIAIPNMIGWLPGYRLRSAAGDIRSNLQLTKMRSIKENRECGILFNPGADSYQVIDGGPDGKYGTGDDTVVKTVKLSEYGSGVAFKANGVSYQNNRAVFQPNGLNKAMGYAYLVNSRGEEARTGTPTLAGVVVCQNKVGGVWQ